MWLVVISIFFPLCQSQTLAGFLDTLFPVIEQLVKSRPFALGNEAGTMECGVESVVPRLQAVHQMDDSSGSTWNIHGNTSLSIENISVCIINIQLPYEVKINMHQEEDFPCNE